MNSLIKKIALLTLALLITACSNGIRGTYEDAIGVTQYTFSSNDKVLFSTLGTEVELAYHLDGDKVKIQMDERTTIVLTKQSDGSLKGPLGMTLSKTK